MKWAVFLLLGWAALGLELSLRKALSLGQSGIAPSFVFCVVTIIAATAPAARAYWMAWLLGLAMDLTFMLPTQSGADARIIGPYALALPAGAYAVISARSLAYKRSPFAYGFLALVGSIAYQACVAVILTVRAGTLDSLDWSAGYEVWTRGASCLYTAALMTLLAPLAPVVQRWMGVQQGSHIAGGSAARI